MEFKKLLNISELSRVDFDEILDNSFSLLEKNISILDNKNIGLIFEKYSTRTRISFNVGIRQLFGNPIDLRFEELNIQRVETFEDTFSMFGLYLDAIIYRTNSHEKLIIASKYFQKPIVNALSDLSHPCQIISDFFTIKQHFHTFENINISWFGDMNNVLFSYCEALRLYPEITLNIFTDQSIYNSNIDNFPISNNINYQFNIDEEILSNSDCIMTDVFTSMNDHNETKNNILSKFQVNSHLMSLTKNTSVFMHCLPANIGSEVTKEVLMSHKSITLKQAQNRLIAQKGILKWLNI